MLYICLLVLSTLTAAGKTTIFKKIGVSSSSTKNLAFSNSVSFFIAMLVALATTGFDVKNIFTISPTTFIISIFYTGVSVLTYFAQIRALSLGTASSTMLVYSCGFLIPIFFTCFFYGETISIVQVIGILVLLVALFLIINPKKGDKLSFAWLIFSILAMSGSGFTAVLQKIHQRSDFSNELSYLLTISFLMSSLIMFILSLVVKEKDSNAKSFINKRVVITACVSGLFIGTLNYLNTFLAGKLPSVILFPIYNIGSIILSGVICAILFKEKNTKKQILGFIIGCFAILLIGLF